MSVYVVVHITAPMVFDVDESKSPPTTSYNRTIELLKKLAVWVRKKKGMTFITYIGKRKVLQNDLKKENPLKDAAEVLQDAVYLADQLEEIRLENDIVPEDTMILFSNAGGYLANVDVKSPCRTQLILMDNAPDEVTKAESSDLQNIADASIDPLLNKTRSKDYKTIQFCKAKNGEVLYRLIKDHFLEFTVRIWVGKLKQPVVLDPPCKIIPKGSLHVVGFLKSSSLVNMPVISTHTLLAPSLLTVSRKEFKEGEHKKKSKKKKKKHTGVVKTINNQKDKKKFLGLLYMLKENLATHDCVAIARHQSGQYCAIYSIKQDIENDIAPEFGVALLDLMEQFKFDELMPLNVTGKLDEQNVQDLRVKSRKDLELPSYAPNTVVKCWTSSQGMNGDVQKIFRTFRKLEKDKVEIMYAEINRLRDYAIVLGLYDFVKEMAEVFRSQTATFGELAQKHGQHIAKHLEKDYDPMTRFDPIPIFNEKEPEKEEKRKCTRKSGTTKMTDTTNDMTRNTDTGKTAAGKSAMRGDVTDSFTDIQSQILSLRNANVMIRMTTRLLFFLTILIFGIPLFLLLNHSDEGRDVNRLWRNLPDDSDELEFSYGVIMDAGSTGTRLFLYKWTSSSDDELIDIRPALDDVGKPVVKKVYPGLSTFAEKPGEAAAYIKPLLDYAIQYIPEKQKEYTPVFLFATAGMRLVPLDAQNAILHDLHSKLPEMTPMQIMKEHIRVIEGKWEGIYSWVAVNYILGNFARKSTGNVDLEENRVVAKPQRKKTVGMIDMGGASCQIAYELPQNETFLSENVENINLGSRDDSADFKYKLFVTTFLGYGVNEGLRKYELQLSAAVKKENLTYVRDECLPVNLQKTVIREDNTSFVRKGIGNWGDCVSKLSGIVSNFKAENKPVCMPSCFFGSVSAPNISLSDMQMYGFSEYWYSVQDVLTLGGKYNHTHLKVKSNQFCAQRWSVIQAAAKKSLYPKADVDRLKTQCFKSAWVTAVLHSGFSISETKNQFESANTISGQEVQWALGAMIYHMRFFPLKNRGFNLVVNKHPDVSSSYPPTIVVFMLIACCIICLFFTYTTLTKNPRVTVGMRRNPSMWSYMAVPMDDSVSTY